MIKGILYKLALTIGLLYLVMMALGLLAVGFAWLHNILHP